MSYIADTPWSGCYPLGYRFTNNDGRSRRLTVMRMLRKNTRAPPPRRLRDRLHAIDARESWLFSLSSRHISRSQSFQEKRPIKIKDLATLKRFVAVIGRSVPCTARLASRWIDRQTDRQTDRQRDRQTDRQTDRPSTVTLAAHARRGLIIMQWNTKCFETIPANLSFSSNKC